MASAMCRTSPCSPATPVSAPLTVIGPDFSIVVAGSASQTISAGQTATFANAVVVSPIDGLNSQVNLTCSLPASLTSCAINPATFSAANGTATVTVTSTARGLASPLLRISRFVRGPKLFLALLITWLLAFTLMGLICIRREGETRLFPRIGLVPILALVTIGCGGGSSGSPQPPSHTGTPAGTYTVTVTGTSGNLTHTEEGSSAP
jgi:hypothetical protein